MAKSKGIPPLILPNWADRVVADDRTWVRLHDICGDIIDCPHSTPVYTESSDNFIARTQDFGGGTLDLTEAARVDDETFADRTRRAVPTHGDLIYSREGAYHGIAAEIPDGPNVCLGQRTVLIRVDPKEANFRFVRYWLNSKRVRSYVAGHKAGSAAPRINLPTIRGLPVALPPLPEQRAIASILGALDDKIELNRRMNATLESLARAIFKSWFVDFDPVKINAGQMPASSAIPTTHDPKVLDLFPSTFQDSELGPIPEGWSVGKFSENIEILSGGTPKTKVEEYWNGEIPWYTVKDAPEGGDVWVIDTERKVTQLGIDNSAAEVFDAGTSIISARGTVGKIALLGVPMSMNQSCYGIKGTNGFSSLFTYYQLNLLTEILQQNTHGTVFDTITRATFEAVECVHPTPELAVEFDRTIADLLQRIHRNLNETTALIATRDTLLPKLLSGELPVTSSLTAYGEALV